MNRITRRDFLVKMQAAGAVLPFAAGVDLLDTKDISGTELFRNDFFSILFNKRTGSLDINRSNGEKFLQGVSVRASSSLGMISTSGDTLKRSARQYGISDILGEGTEIKITTVDNDLKIEFVLKLILYKNYHAIFIEAEVHNRSVQPLIIQNIEPVGTESETGGKLYWPGTTRLLTNGPMYYNPGEVVGMDGSGNISRESWWNISLFRGYNKEGLAIGSVENLDAQGKILVKWTEDGQINVTALSILSDGFTLNPGKSARSNRFVFNIGKDPYDALEDYAGFMGRINKARVSSVINGWCNWFYTYEHINEDEIIRNAEFAARVLKPYGFEYIQVDEGYQKWHGEWDGNERFPHGMKWLGDKIHSLGLKPGIWIAPYVISEPAGIFSDHKEWLIRHPDGSLKRVGPWPGEDTDWAKNENPKRYGLDITHPGAADWLYSLFEKISKQWGYEMIKIDFVDWSLLSAHHYHDPSVSRATAYRRGFEIMRSAAGDNCHLQDCGPGPITVGLTDSMRIELDQNYGYRKDVWRQYFNSTGSAPATAKRYYFHKRTWINDADHLCMNLLSASQAQAAATLISLTGGNTISGDRLPELDPVRIEILKKTFPSYGESARPADLFDTDFHRIFSLNVKKPFGEWTIIGIFNSDESKMQEYELPLGRLFLDEAKNYICFDFWNSTFLGEVKNSLKCKVQPYSCLLLSLHEKTGKPQFISSDRHILQGAVELEDQKWDDRKQVLTGISTGIPEDAYNVYIYVPDPHPWKQGGTALYHDFRDYSMKMTDDNILRIHLKFKNESKIIWEVNFPDFFI